VSKLSSGGGGCDVAPSGGFVIEDAALEAGVEDADPSVGELSECLPVGLATVAELVVVAPGAG
jgi:hypothetical protein